jgi:hypothetical protein
MKYNENNTYIILITAYGHTTTKEAGITTFLGLQIHDY